jgi:hypothetical protein
MMLSDAECGSVLSGDNWFWFSWLPEIVGNL